MRCKFCGQQEKDEHCLTYWHCYYCNRTVPYCFGGSTDNYCNDCFHKATTEEKPHDTTTTTITHASQD